MTMIATTRRNREEAKKNERKKRKEVRGKAKREER